MDLEYMYEVCSSVFDVLEHVWMTTKKCQLIDLKIEFGWTAAKEIVVANVYDIDTWHVLPFDGQQHSPEENLSWINNALREILGLNIQMTLKNVGKLKGSRWSVIEDPTEDAPSASNAFESDCEGNEKQSLSLSAISQPSLICRCIIVCSTLHDIEYGQKLRSTLNETYSIPCDVRLCSLHRSSQTVHKLLANYSYEHCRPTVFVTVGTVNNDLAMCLASNSPYPVIHCLLTEHDKTHPVLDWNSFTSTQTPLYTLVFTLMSAAHSVGQILAMHDWKLWAKQRGRRFKKYMEFILADQHLMVTQTSKGTTGFSMSK
jgi:phosphoribosylcarboxyaminoimidazole (NCAIR) mutase